MMEYKIIFLTIVVSLLIYGWYRYWKENKLRDRSREFSEMWDSNGKTNKENKDE